MQYVNHRVFERKWRLWVILRACLAECRGIVFPLFGDEGWGWLRMHLYKVTAFKNYWDCYSVWECVGWCRGHWKIVLSFSLCLVSLSALSFLSLCSLFLLFLCSLCLLSLLALHSLFACSLSLCCLLTLSLLSALSLPSLSLLFLFLFLSCVCK